MIDPTEAKTRTLTISYGSDLPQFSVVGKFTAPEDLTLRKVIFFGPGIVSIDPDLTLLEANIVSQEFQLIALVEDSRPITQIVDNLAYPLLTGQTLYYGSTTSGSAVQLIFS